MDTIIIDQRTDDHSSGLAARKLWKALYKLTNAQNWGDLNDFLIDLRLFQEIVDEVYDPANDGIRIFWWSWDKSGWTWVTNYDPDEEDCYKVTIDRRICKSYKIIIENVGRIQ